AARGSQVLTATSQGGAARLRPTVVSQHRAGGRAQRVLLAVEPAPVPAPQSLRGDRQGENRGPIAPRIRTRSRTADSPRTSALVQRKPDAPLRQYEGSARTPPRA